jgi:hypothetical protein
VIAFDDDQTSLDVILKALREGTFPVKGKTVYLKEFPDEAQSN